MSVEEIAKLHNGEWVNATEMGRRLEVNPQTVHSAIKRGRFDVDFVTRSGHNIYVLDCEASRAQFFENRDTSKVSRKRNDNLNSKGAMPGADGIGDEVKRKQLSYDDSGYESRVRAQNQSRELDNQRKAVDLMRKKIALDRERGDLLPKKELEARMMEAGIFVRRKVQEVPARIIDDLLASSNRAEAMKIFTQAIDAALEECADYIERNFSS